MGLEAPFQFTVDRPQVAQEQPVAASIRPSPEQRADNAGALRFGVQRARPGADDVEEERWLPAVHAHPTSGNIAAIAQANTTALAIAPGNGWPVRRYAQVLNRP